MQNKSSFNTNKATHFDGLRDEELFHHSLSLSHSFSADCCYCAASYHFIAIDCSLCPLIVVSVSRGRASPTPTYSRPTKFTLKTRGESGFWLRLLPTLPYHKHHHRELPPQQTLSHHTSHTRFSYHSPIIVWPISPILIHSNKTAGLVVPQQPSPPPGPTPPELLLQHHAHLQPQQCVARL